MKYLIVKGWLGFGDRLESLKMAVKYALDKKLAIYVDWEDETWSHSGESFYTYFDLKMPSFTLNEIGQDMKIFPAFWKDKLKEPLTQKIIDSNPDLKLPSLGEKEYDCDVLVYPSIGIRFIYYDSKFFTDVFRVKDQRIIANVKKQGNLSNTWGIHIRGTDRLRQGRRTLSIQSLCLHMVNYGALNGPSMIVVSDDKESLKIFKNFYPQAKVPSNNSIQLESSKGNHNLKKEELKVSKDEMNVEMLSDFFILASCSLVLSTFKDSRFAQEARRLHPHIANIIL